MKQKVELGDKVKCKYTGFIGTAISKTEFINRCIQFGVVPVCKKNNMFPEEMGIDETTLVIIAKAKSTIKDKEEIEENGGSVRKTVVQRGY